MPWQAWSIGHTYLHQVACAAPNATPRGLLDVICYRSPYAQLNDHVPSMVDNKTWRRGCHVEYDYDTRGRLRRRNRETTTSKCCFFPHEALVLNSIPPSSHPETAAIHPLQRLVNPVCISRN